MEVEYVNIVTVTEVEAVRFNVKCAVTVDVDRLFKTIWYKPSLGICIVKL